MRAFPALALCVALLPACRSADAPQSATTAAEIQEAMATHEQAQPLEGHAWLDQLVGEWSVSVGGGELEGMSFEYDERVRKIGELWVQAEGSAESFTSQLTLGYDPAKGGFVGTWIDTMQTTLWVYSGRLEEDGARWCSRPRGRTWPTPRSARGTATPSVSSTPTTAR